MCAGSVNTKLRSAVKEWYFQGERSKSSTFLLYRSLGLIYPAVSKPRVVILSFEKMRPQTFDTASG